MSTPAPFGTRLTVDAIAPEIDGVRRPAPQPLGTWMSRWAAIYLDVVPAAGTPGIDAPVRVAPVRALPHVIAA